MKNLLQITIILLFKFVNTFVKIFSFAKGLSNSFSVNQKDKKRMSKIGPNVKLSYPGNIYIGTNSYINGGHFKASKNAKIVIGDDCLISFEVHMRTDMHNYADKNTLIKNQGSIEKDIIVGDDVWIGYGAQILSGVKIGRGVVIAAGSIVTKDIEEYSVVAGVPAKIIKYREII
ncbi:acyltransferase [Planococcus salinarum]|uniref:acyltransferase n=1 Tax=Planococcus salinarum TaxID=622695 RepID=UPI000E3E1B4C|nr:acyltransferase [Planococcus salinarum]TAA72853.1 acyltransferase [Planococcus salinarum]